VAIAAHPGYAATDLVASGTEMHAGFVGAFNGVFAQSAERGSLPTVYAALDNDAQSGRFYGPDGWLLELWGSRVAPAHVPHLAKDEDLAKRLWDLSEEVTNVKFHL
jgi:hypothetical protein